MIWGIIILLLFFILIIAHRNQRKELNLGSGVIKETDHINGRTFMYARNATGNKMPVIIVLHGRTQSADIWFENSAQGAFVKKAINERFAVIAPDSTTPICQGVKQWDYTKDFSDKAFFEGIFNWIDNQSEFDKERIYVTGISSGGFMTSRVGMVFADKVKAIAIASGGDADYSSVRRDNGCRTTFDKSVPIIEGNQPKTLFIHGDIDPIVPFSMDQNYYTALKDKGVETRFIKNRFGTHLWYNKYDQDILDWFN